MSFYRMWCTFEEEGSERPWKWNLDLPHLNPDGTWKDVWAYSRCERLAQTEPVKLVIYEDGRRVDINFASFNIVVVSKRIGSLLEEMAPGDIQLLPAAVAGDDGEWRVLNILTEIDCIDHNKSWIDYYPSSPEPWEDAERAGKPRGVRLLRIDPARVGDHHIFRIKDWEVAVIVSEQIQNALLAEQVEGIRFIPVVE